LGFLGKKNRAWGFFQGFVRDGPRTHRKAPKTPTSNSPHRSPRQQTLNRIPRRRGTGRQVIADYSNDSIGHHTSCPGFETGNLENGSAESEMGSFLPAKSPRLVSEDKPCATGFSHHFRREKCRCIWPTPCSIAGLLTALRAVSHRIESSFPRKRESRGSK